MKYKVLSPLHHNGVVYKPGEEVDLDDREAASLLEVRCIETTVKPFSKKAEKTALHTQSQEY